MSTDSLNYSVAGCCDVWVRDSHPAWEHGAFSDATRRAIALIQSDFADPDLSVAKVARKLGFNCSYLSHRFRLETHSRMAAYIVARRLRRACELLMSTELHIQDVAISSGFQNTDWFSHVFHQAVGITPTRFRRLSRMSAPGPSIAL